MRNTIGRLQWRQDKRFDQKWYKNLGKSKEGLKQSTQLAEILALKNSLKLKVLKCEKSDSRIFILLRVRNLPFQVFFFSAGNSMGTARNLVHLFQICKNLNTNPFALFHSFSTSSIRRIFCQEINRHGPNPIYHFQIPRNQQNSTKSEKPNISGSVKNPIQHIKN